MAKTPLVFATNPVGHHVAKGLSPQMAKPQELRWLSHSATCAGLYCFFNQYSDEHVPTTETTDSCSMNRKQPWAKFSRYQAWMESEVGKESLLALYRRRGATDLRLALRLVIIAKNRGDDDDRRVAEILVVARRLQSCWIEWGSRLAKVRRNNRTIANRLVPQSGEG